MFGRRGAGELRRVEIASPAGQPVRDGERSDRLSSEFGKQSTALDLVGLGVDKRNGSKMVRVNSSLSNFDRNGLMNLPTFEDYWLRKRKQPIDGKGKHELEPLLMRS